MTPSQRARTGLFYLKEAILEVLLHESNLTQSEISKRLGIPPSQVANRFGIIGGILGLLQEEGLVQNDGDPNALRWSLTETQRDLLSFILEE